MDDHLGCYRLLVPIVEIEATSLILGPPGTKKKSIKNVKMYLGLKIYGILHLWFSIDLAWDWIVFLFSIFGVNVGVPIILCMGPCLIYVLIVARPNSHTPLWK